MSNKPYFAIGLSPDQLVDVSSSLRELNITNDSLFSIEATGSRKSFKSGEIVTSSGCLIEIREIEIFPAKIVSKRTGQNALGWAGTGEHTKPRDCEWQPNKLEQRFLKIDSKGETHKIISAAHFMYQVRLAENEYPYDDTHYFIFGTLDIDNDEVEITREVRISP